VFIHSPLFFPPLLFFSTNKYNHFYLFFPISFFFFFECSVVMNRLRAASARSSALCSSS
jgi:hypothetical protein